MKKMLFLYLYTLACLGYVVCAFAGELEHTAVLALKDLRQWPHAAEWEYSGFIVNRHGALLYVSAPHTDQASDHVIPDILTRLLPGDKLAGIYHNHPCYSTTHYTDYFSRADLIQAKFYDVPAFMLDNCTGDVHEFDWSVDNVRATGKDQHVILPDGRAVVYHLTPGRIVGNIGITSRNLDADEAAIVYKYTDFVGKAKP